MAKEGGKLAALKPGVYKVAEEKLDRMRQHCPKCGPGVFLAQHANRVSCGRCGYTEFRK